MKLRDPLAVPEVSVPGTHDILPAKSYIHFWRRLSWRGIPSDRKL